MDEQKPKPLSYERQLFYTELKNPLGEFFASVTGGPIYINLTCATEIKAGTKVAFDREKTACNEVSLADYGRLYGVALVDAAPNEPILVLPKGLLDFDASR